MSKLFTLFILASATGFAAYGLYPASQSPEPREPVIRQVQPILPIKSPALVPISTEMPNTDLATRPLLPRAASLLLQPGALFLSQAPPSPLGTVTLSLNTNIGGSGQSGWTGVGGGYAWAYYAWHLPYHVVPFDPNDAMMFLEAWTDPAFAGFMPGSGSGFKHRLYFPVAASTPAPAVQNMVPLGNLGGLTFISPTP